MPQNVEGEAAGETIEEYPIEKHEPGPAYLEEPASALIPAAVGDKTAPSTVIPATATTPAPFPAPRVSPKRLPPAPSSSAGGK
jgi:hypothetical protein